MKKIMRSFLFLFCVAMTGCVSQTLAWRPDVQSYTNELVHRYHFDRKELNKLFCHLHSNPEVLRHLHRPAEAMPWIKYESAFLTHQRIAEGIKFSQKHQQVLRQLETRYEVPAPILVAIIGVETNYGAYQPKFNAAEALATIAFSNSKRRAFFKSEFTNLLLLSRERHVDPLQWRSSYAGALGIPQFMPSSYRRFAVKYQNDGKPIDLDHNINDALASVANYLKHFGWQPHQLIAKRMAQMPHVLPRHTLVLDDRRGKEYWHTLHNFDVILRYNTSSWYVMAVYELADAIAASHIT